MSATALRHRAAFVTSIGVAVLALVTAHPASAEGVCAAANLPVGAEVHGPVLQVLDGGRLCVALDFDHWIALDVAQSDADGSSRGALMAAAFAQTADCQVTATASGQTFASCRIEGHTLKSRLADPQVVRAAIAWR